MVKDTYVKNRVRIVSRSKLIVDVLFGRIMFRIESKFTFVVVLVVVLLLLSCRIESRVMVTLLDNVEITDFIQTTNHPVMSERDFWLWRGGA